MILLFSSPYGLREKPSVTPFAEGCPGINFLRKVNGETSEAAIKVNGETSISC